MAGGDEDRAGVFPCPEDEADLFVVCRAGRAAEKRRVAAGFGAGLGIMAAEAALGAADRRKVEDEAGVAGEAEAPRMGNAVTIEHQQVRPGAEFSPGFEQSGEFAKTEQAGPIWKIGDSADGHLFDDLQVGEAQKNDAGMDDIGEAIEGDVRAGNDADISFERNQADLLAEALLQPDGLRWRDVPDVWVTAVQLG